MLTATTQNQSHTMNKVHNNVHQFKEVYKEIVEEIIIRRKAAGFTQESLAEWFEVDRRKIIQLEKCESGVGLLLRVAELFDLDIKLIVNKN